MEGLGLVALVVVQLSQLGQRLGVSGGHTDDLHQPLDGLLGILQELVPAGGQSRSKHNPTHQEINKINSLIFPIQYIHQFIYVPGTLGR